jgi:hypothetical protein
MMVFYHIFIYHDETYLSIIYITYHLTELILHAEEASATRISKLVHVDIHFYELIASYQGSRLLDQHWLAVESSADGGYAVVLDTINETHGLFWDILCVHIHTHIYIHTKLIHVHIEKCKCVCVCVLQKDKKKNFLSSYSLSHVCGFYLESASKVNIIGG